MNRKVVFLFLVLAFVATILAVMTLLPKEIPTYVGLSADEVTKLREQCLQENSASLCLPLPVDPTLLGLSIRDVEFTHNYFIGGARYPVAEKYVMVYLPSDARIAAPTSGVFQIERRYSYIVPNLEELSLTEVCWMDGSLTLCLTARDGPLSEEMFRTFGNSKILAETVSDNLVLGIWQYRQTILRSGEEVPASGITSADLLRNGFGSLVFSMPSPDQPDD